MCIPPEFTWLISIAGRMPTSNIYRSIEDNQSLIDCDANTRYPFSSSSEIDEKDKSLFNSNINTNLSVSSMDLLSLWNCDGWEEVLGMTILTNKETFKVEN